LDWIGLKKEREVDEEEEEEKRNAAADGMGLGTPPSPIREAETFVPLCLPVSVPASTALPLHSTGTATVCVCVCVWWRRRPASLPELGRGGDPRLHLSPRRSPSVHPPHRRRPLPLRAFLRMASSCFPFAAQRRNPPNVYDSFLPSIAMYIAPI